MELQISRGSTPLLFFNNTNKKWTKILSYQNHDLQKLFEDRILKKHKIILDPDIIFFEFKKLLFIMSESQLKLSHNKNFKLFEQISLLDEYWHMFILMTREYSWFCENILGNFLHHAPEVTNSTNSSQILNNNLETELLEQIELVVSYHGEETAYNWYISDKYNFKKLSEFKD